VEGIKGVGWGRSAGKGRKKEVRVQDRMKGGGGRRGRIKSLRLTASPVATTLDHVDTLEVEPERSKTERGMAMGLSWSAQRFFAGEEGFGYVTKLFCTLFVVLFFHCNGWLVL
jgi:hypothetical protein